MRRYTKRTQPVVIAHEARGRHFSESSAWVVDAYMTNEGGGPAFNVRFGVEFHGVRYPYRLQPDDPDGGNLQRVIRPEEQRPASASWPILIDSTQLFGVSAAEGDPDPTRAYWSRYENAQGKTWETRNPWDRSAKLDIRRVRFVSLREWRETRERQKTSQHGLEWERKVLAELREARDEAQATEGGSSSK